MTETTLVRQLPPDLKLEAGGHSEAKDAMCIMEAVAFVAGEKWSDAPACTSPVIRRFCIGLNDRWDDESRQLLVPYIPKVIGTTGTKEQELMRKYLAIDWAYRVGVPRSLRFAKMDDLALRLESLPQITDADEHRKARVVMNEIYGATAARRDAARAEIRARLQAAAAAAAEAEAEVEAEVAAVEVVAAVEAEVEAEVAAVEVVAAVAVAVVAEVAEISRALAAEGGSGSWAQPIAKIFRDILPTLPKGADYWAIRSAIYHPVRAEVRRLIQAGEFGGEEYRAHRAGMRTAALELLDQLIAVTA